MAKKLNIVYKDSTTKSSFYGKICIVCQWNVLNTHAHVCIKQSYLDTFKCKVLVVESLWEIPDEMVYISEHENNQCVEVNYKTK